MDPHEKGQSAYPLLDFLRRVRLSIMAWETAMSIVIARRFRPFAESTTSGVEAKRSKKCRQAQDPEQRRNS